MHQIFMFLYLIFIECRRHD